MRLEQYPIHRKVIVPWYDSEIACLVMIVLMTATMLFGAIGVSVAVAKPAFQSYMWVPLAVVVLSVGVITSASLRMARRYLRRISD